MQPHTHNINSIFEAGKMNLRAPKARSVDPSVPHHYTRRELRPKYGFITNKTKSVAWPPKLTDSDPF